MLADFGCIFHEERGQSRAERFVTWLDGLRLDEDAAERSTRCRDEYRAYRKGAKWAVTLIARYFEELFDV
jgi:hypothetical protein